MGEAFWSRKAPQGEGQINSSLQLKWLVAASGNKKLFLGAATSRVESAYCYPGVWDSWTLTLKFS